MLGAPIPHVLICVNVGVALGTLLRGTSARVFGSDARVHIGANRYVYPDITVSCSPEDMRDPKAVRSPRVVFEVLMSSTEKFDRHQKTKMYRACPSIEAVVLVDPGQLLVEIFQRDGAFWHYFQYDTTDALVDIEPLSIQIPIAEFYRDIDLPPVPPMPSQVLEP
jgi:Uma2 family endonuclease